MSHSFLSTYSTITLSNSQSAYKRQVTVGEMKEKLTSGADFQWNPEKVTELIWSLSADDSRGLKNFITTNCNHLNFTLSTAQQNKRKMGP